MPHDIGHCPKIVSTTFASRRHNRGTENRTVVDGSFAFHANRVSLCRGILGAYIRAALPTLTRRKPFITTDTDLLPLPHFLQAHGLRRAKQLLCGLPGYRAAVPGRIDGSCFLPRIPSTDVLIKGPMRMPDGEI
jgi:hypothetical protein